MNVKQQTLFLPLILLQKGTWPPTASSILVKTVKSVSQYLGAGQKQKRQTNTVKSTD